MKNIKEKNLDWRGALENLIGALYMSTIVECINSSPTGKATKDDIDECFASAFFGKVRVCLMTIKIRTGVQKNMCKKCLKESTIVSTETIRPRFLRQKYAADYLGISAPMLLNLVKAGEIEEPLRPAYRWVLYSLASLDAYADALKAKMQAAKASKASVTDEPEVTEDTEGAATESTEATTDTDGTEDSDIDAATDSEPTEATTATEASGS